MVPKVTLISNLKMNFVTKFQVFIFKNDEVRSEATWNRVKCLFSVKEAVLAAQGLTLKKIISLQPNVDI